MTLQSADAESAAPAERCYIQNILYLVSETADANGPPSPDTEFLTWESLCSYDSITVPL